MKEREAEVEEKKELRKGGGERIGILGREIEFGVMALAPPRRVSDAVGEDTSDNAMVRSALRACSFARLFVGTDCREASLG